MSATPERVPIIGQQQRVVISDHSIIAPNSVEVIDNGLSMGASVAHLRIMDPLKGRCVMVPLIINQVEQLASALTELAIDLGKRD